MAFTGGHLFEKLLGEDLVDCVDPLTHLVLEEGDVLGDVLLEFELDLDELVGGVFDVEMGGDLAAGLAEVKACEEETVVGFNVFVHVLNVRLDSSVYDLFEVDIVESHYVPVGRENWGKGVCNFN